MTNASSSPRTHCDAQGATPHSVIILHGIGHPTRPLEPGEDKFWISEALFESCLDAIVGMGASAPHITFDDGNASDMEIAFPALQAHSLKASFFVLTNRIDTPGSLTSEDVTTLAQAGHTIGLHGADHVDWRGLDEAGRLREFETARDRLATLCGKPVETAAAPFGLYNRQTVRDLKALGFRALYTSDRGLACAQDFIRPRNCLEGDMSQASLRAALRGDVPKGRRMRRLMGMARKRLLPLRTRS